MAGSRIPNVVGPSGGLESLTWRPSDFEVTRSTSGVRRQARIRYWFRCRSAVVCGPTPWICGGALVRAATFPVPADLPAWSLNTLRPPLTDAANDPFGVAVIGVLSPTDSPPMLAPKSDRGPSRSALAICPLSTPRQIPPTRRSAGTTRQLAGAKHPRFPHAMNAERREPPVHQTSIGLRQAAAPLPRRGQPHRRPLPASSPFR